MDPCGARRSGSAVGAVALGIGSALAVPFWLRTRRLPTLLAEPGATPARCVDATAALYASRVTIRGLARIPGLPWRNTCLYRSVAECLVLRACGHPARLRLGVRRNDSFGGNIEAHAWVEGFDRSTAEAGYQPLSGGAGWAAE